MQCFRLMGLPDKVIAFDQLPERMLKGFELCRAEGFPRHWKQWMGTIKLKTNIPPEKDFLTGQVRYFDPIIEEDSFFYLVDYSLNQSSEKWKEVCDFVRQVVSKDFRLMDKIDEMAKPLAANKTDGVTLEPEDVVIIPIPIEYQEILVKSTDKIETNKKDVKKEEKAINVMKCAEPGCTSEFEGSHSKNALRLHTMKKHKKEVVSV